MVPVQIGTFRTPLRDGWGITTVGTEMVLSDGSSRLTFVDPAQRFKAVRAVIVTDGSRSIAKLNEVRVLLHVGYHAHTAQTMSTQFWMGCKLPLLVNSP